MNEFATFIATRFQSKYYTNLYRCPTIQAERQGPARHYQHIFEGFMRKYEDSHSWIAFNLDTRRLHPKSWMLLGEACSKCDHIANAPLRPDVANRLYRLYLAKGVAATTAIEGNTLSEEEVRLHLEGKLRLPPSKAYLQQEVDNIATASNEIARQVMGGTLGGIITTEQIKHYNRQVQDGLETDEDVYPGQIRQHSVVVMRYKGAPAEDCEFLLARMCEWLNDPSFLPDEMSQRMAWGILRAILAHLYIAWIHPFADGNGRTARLVELQILMDSCVPMPAAHLLSNFYNQTRSEYYRQLDYASRSGGDVTRFIEYALQGLVDGLKEQLGVIRNYQWEVAWRDLVFRTFHGRSGTTDDRRRELALALSSRPEPVGIADIPKLSDRLLIAYHHKTPRTIQRDLQELIQMDLVTRTGVQYQANRKVILGFLPPRREIDPPEIIGDPGE